jgi:hypothetical protein
MNLSRTGTQNPSDYDLESVALHEITETLGAGGAGSGIPSTVNSLDLFRYSAPGVRSWATGTGVTAYFSINGGTSNLRNFNQADAGSDYADWASSGTPHVQDAYGTPGSAPNLDGIELTALDVVGYNLTPAGTALEDQALGVPEPSSLALLGAAAIAATVGLVRRRQRG